MHRTQVGFAVSVGKLDDVVQLARGSTKGKRSDLKSDTRGMAASLLATLVQSGGSIGF
jgi:hypothetical protein